MPAIDQLRTTITSISYNFHFGPRAAFEPYVLYRTTKGLPDQYEGMGVLRIDDKYWIGGSYRVDYGASAFLGFTIKDQIRLGYAYEFAAATNQVLGNGTHEFQLMVRLGKRKVRPEPTIPVPPMETPVTEQPKEQPKEEVKVETKQPAVDTTRTAPVETPVVQQQQETPREVPPIVQPPSDSTKLPPGFYVVVGVFAAEAHANEFHAALQKAGFNATVEHYPTRQFFFVHVGHYTSLPPARATRDEFRSKPDFSFRDTWVLRVE
jgi:cell division septation protein DedD